MLSVIENLNDPLINLIKDDPVRPEIPSAARIHEQAEIFVWHQNDAPAAVTCVKYTQDVPADVQGLDSNIEPTVAVFYTIWSYQKGSGQKLIRAAQKHILATRPHITRFVTLSPKTDMASAFHHKNGAFTLRENSTTVNYEYQAEVKRREDCLVADVA